MKLASNPLMKSYFPLFSPHGHAHIGTNELQLCMIKTALLIGCVGKFGTGVCGILDPQFVHPFIPLRQKFSVWTLDSEEAKVFVKRPTEETAEFALKTVTIDINDIERVNKIDFIESAASQEGAVTRSV